MGAAARWFKALIGIKKSKGSSGGKDDLKSTTASKSKRWIVRKLGMGKQKEDGHQHAGDFCGGVVIAPSEHTADYHCHSDSLDSKRHLAAIKIQSVFRRFLARRAFLALRALVRIQAIFRGRRVRKQVEMNPHCHLHAHTQAWGNHIMPPMQRKDWCGCQGTAQEIKARLHHKQAAAIRRERAMAYALLHQIKARKAFIDQCWQCEKDVLEQEMEASKSPSKLRTLPKIAIAYYYSGPIFSTSPLSSSSLSCACGHDSVHLHQYRSKNSCHNMPKYMDTTISMQAKQRSLSIASLQNPSAQLHCKRRHASIACLDTHHLLLQCS